MLKERESKNKKRDKARRLQRERDKQREEIEIERRHIDRERDIHTREGKTTHRGNTRTDRARVCLLGGSGASSDVHV